MSIVEFLSQPLWQRVGLTLVHFLWQGLAVAVLVGVLVRVFRLNHGNARYAAYLLAFIAMMVCPVVTFTVIDIPISPNTGLVTAAEFPQGVDNVSYTVLPAGDILPESETSSPVIPTLADSIPLGQRISDWLNVWMPWVLVIWMVGVIVLSVRLLMGFVGVYRWRHHLEPLPERLAQRIASLSERLGMRGFSRVFISPTVLQAMAVGYLRPMVLLPVAMVTQMQPEMLEAVMAHELAHIRRLDLWVNLAQRVTETLLFYHPAVWWLSICLRSERELCCDELAVKATGERITYATTLESVGRARFMAKPPVLAAGLGHDDKPTLGRVRHILGLAPTQRNCPCWLAGVIAVLFLAAIAIPTTFALRNQSDEKVNDLESVVVVGARSMSESEILTALKTSDRVCEADFSASGTGMVRSIASPSESPAPTEWSITKTGDTWVLKEDVLKIPVPSVEMVVAENAGFTTEGLLPSTSRMSRRLVYIAPDISAICTGDVMFQMRADQTIAKREEQMNVVHIFRLDDRPMMPLNYVMWSMGRGHSIYIEKIKSVSNHGEGTVKCECVSKVLGFPEQCELVIDTANAHLVRSAKYFIGGRAVLAVSTTGTRWENDRCLPESAVISELSNGREVQMPFVCRSFGTDPNRELIKRARDAVYGPYPVLTNVIDQRTMPWQHSVVDGEGIEKLDIETLLSKVRKALQPTDNMRVSWQFETVEPFGVGTTKSPHTVTEYTATISGFKSRLEGLEKTYSSKASEDPYDIRRKTYVFDGKQCRYLEERIKGGKTTPLGWEKPQNVAIVLLYQELFACILPLHNKDKLTEYKLSSADSPSPGIYVIKTIGPEDGTPYQITIDGSRGFNIINTQWFGPKNTKTLEDTTVLRQYDDGIWYPAERRRIRYYPNGTHKLEHIQKFSKLELDAKVPEETFKLEFPPGTKTWDTTLEDWVIISDTDTSDKKPATSSEPIRNVSPTLGLDKMMEFFEQDIDLFEDAQRKANLAAKRLRWLEIKKNGGAMSSQELVSEIRAKEKRLLNLQVSSALWVEQRESGGSKWERTPVQLSCTAWYDGLTGGKVRVDVDKEVLEWKDGAAPFSESSYSVAFDGQYGRSAFHKEGPLGDMAGYRSGVISPDVPPQLRTKWTSRATGVAFSTFFFYNEESKKFSDVLAEGISSENGKTTISRELLQQANCIRITYGDASAGHESFWLDPDRGFALIGHEDVNVTKDGRKLVVASDRVTKLTEAAPGIWFPTEAYHEWTPIPSRGETYETRMHYVASAVTANDSTFDESIFTLTFPPGYRIRDKTGRR